MIQAGHSPSVRLFEAAACGVPIITDAWPGIEEFFVPNEEILVAETTEDVVRWLSGATMQRRRQLGESARARVLAAHTAAHRAARFEEVVLEHLKPRRRNPPKAARAGAVRRAQQVSE